MKQLTLVLLLLSQATLAQTTWKIQSAVVGFRIKNAGLMVEGTLTGFEGMVKFDSKTYAQSSIKGSVLVNTIKTGIATRDNHLQKEEYFYAVNYPKIELVSSFFGKSENGFKGYFKLTIKGVTKDVIIPFTWNEQGNKAIASGTFNINRLDFGIGQSSLILSNNVIIDIQLNLSKQ